MSHRAIHTAMRSAGYDRVAQAEGFALLCAVDDAAIVQALRARGEAVSAVAAISAWLCPSFLSIQAALSHLHPEQALMVFADFTPASGDASLAATQDLLRRIDSLGRGTVEDRRALTTLAHRGFDARELGRVRELLRRAHMAPSAAALAIAFADHEARLRALRDWYEDWSAVARARIKNRNHLIQLGLARRVERLPRRARDMFRAA